MENFDTCFERIKTETKIATLSDLADAIGRRQPTISEAKKKGQFHAQWAYELELKTGLLTRWIMTGEGPKRHGEPQDSTPDPVIQTESADMPVYFTDLVAWGREFSGSGNLEWLENLLDSCLPAFKKWRDQKSGEAEASILQNQVKRKVA